MSKAEEADLYNDGGWLPAQRAHRRSVDVIWPKLERVEGLQNFVEEHALLGIVVLRQKQKRFPIQ